MRLSDYLITVPTWMAVFADFYGHGKKGGTLDRLKWHWFERLESVKSSLPPPVPEPLPEIAAKNYSFQALQELSLNFQRPVVVRDLFADVPAIEKWKSPNFFIENYGDQEYSIMTKGNPRATYKAAENAEDLKVGAEPFTDRSTMSMREFLERSIAGEPLYLFVHDILLHDNPELLDDLDIPGVMDEWWEGPDVPLDPFLVQMFMGIGRESELKTTGLGLHCAAHLNVFVQVAGRKRWTFVDPKYSLFLHPSMDYAKPACLATPPFDIETLPRQQVMLNPGDMLMNPPWVWHAIENLDGFNVGISTRQLNFWGTLRNNPLFTVIPEFAFMWLNNEQLNLVRSGGRVHPIGKALRKVPFFILAAGLASEALRGYVEPPFRAYRDAGKRADIERSETVFTKNDKRQRAN